MNKRTSTLLVVLLGFTAAAFAEAPATPAAQGTPAVSASHVVKAGKGKSIKKKVHTHRKQAAASAATTK